MPPMQGEVNNGASTVRLVSTGDAIVIQVHGVLDETAVRTIDAAATGALEAPLRRICVDLGNLVGFTPAGATAFASLQTRLPPGCGRRIFYHASSNVGQDALRAACSRVPGGASA